MNIIILEGLMFVALLAIGVTLAVFIIRHYTAPGRVLEQTRNRKEIERVASLTCPLHGAHEEREMVRLESGEVLCPECYREAIDGRV
jgi:hypothetical protein